MEQIAEVLKGIFNSALECLRKGNLYDAESMFAYALDVSKTFGYADGQAMALESLANVSVMRCDFGMAMSRLSAARELGTADSGRIGSTLSDLADAVVRRGIKSESSEDYEEALSMFRAALPFLEGERREAVEYEINLLEEADVE